MAESTGNYEKQVYQARELFLKYDQEEMIRKYQLEQDPEFLYLKLLLQPIRISRSTGEVWQQNISGQWERCIDYELVMTVYDVLCTPVSDPKLSGAWGPLHGLQATMSSPSPDKLFGAYGQCFQGKAEALADACRALEGEAQAIPKSADVCSKIWILPFFPVIFQFWDGDEEFAPKIMLLWDRNALDFMHFETLYYVIGLLLQRLLELCGISPEQRRQA